jgi:hypothetical protein
LSIKDMASSAAGKLCSAPLHNVVQVQTLAVLQLSYNRVSYIAVTLVTDTDLVLNGAVMRVVGRTHPVDSASRPLFIELRQRPRSCFQELDIQVGVHYRKSRRV